MCIRDSFAFEAHPQGIEMPFGAGAFGRDFGELNINWRHPHILIGAGVPEVDAKGQIEQRDIQPHKTNPVSYTHLDVYKRQR